MRSLVIMALGFLAGCGGLDFRERWTPDGLTFHEPVPYLFVSVDKDCVSKAQIVSLPGRERSVGFKTGWGSTDLSVALDNGMITSVGQTTDPKIPETMTAIAGLATLGLGTMRLDDKGNRVVTGTCRLTGATLYPITEGKIDTSKGVKLFQ